ncbi:MAG TPA: TRCF domain-containing protein [Stellaceae bacterium]
MPDDAPVRGRAAQWETVPNGPEGVVALRLAEWTREAGAAGLIHVARSETRADRLARAVRGLMPDLEVLVFPPWDCLPYDRASPSREVMGRRLAVLRRLADRAADEGGTSRPCLVVTTIEGLTQRLPPRTVLRDRGASFALAVGGELRRDAFEDFLRCAGYVIDDRVDEPGEAAIRGEVIDLYPAGDALPCRIDHDDGRVAGIRRYDPATQRTVAEIDRLVVGPASEVVLRSEEKGEPEPEPEHYPGIEHELPRFYHPLDLLFDYLPDADLVLEPEIDDRRAARFEQIADAHEGRRSLPVSERRRAVHIVPPDHFYVGEPEWRRHVDEGRRHIRRLADPADDGVPSDGEAIPRFLAEADPIAAFTRFAEARLTAGDHIALAAADERTLGRLAGTARRWLHRDADRVAGWPDLQRLPSGTLAAIAVDLDTGFVLPGTVVVAAADVLGSRARSAAAAAAAHLGLPAGGVADLRPGDVVIHVEHGMGVLRGLETMRAGGGGDAAAAETVGDCLRIDYAGGETLLVPVEEIDKVWRYGADESAVSLDRLDGEGWKKRRVQVEADIAETARALVAAARERAKVTAPSFHPPRRAYERFVARFPFAETADQARAIDETLRDLASGKPMDRLVCGDVGFGKTEVALRAVAAVALSGKQVALAAPMTVLVRQHLETFRRRFAGFDGVAVEQLSRLVKPAEARRVKKGLADGGIRIAIGTHALAGKGVAFKDLGLLVIDEEQRFGTKQKQMLRALGKAGVHVLTLTATPIPRTLQAALVGLQELSVIATPPVRRQPIRTFVMPFDPVVVREALRRERARGGQSFVVCPHIDDIEPMAERLAALAPELEILCAHGRMPADRLDQIIVGFADGRGDVLLATNIIETGLDVPAANTILVWRADRFGLAQLHQLRGRVGRGRVRAACYLMTDPQAKVAAATEKRLRTLESLDRLGAGFAISARDLDLRGAGDLVGSDQAGHMKLIGIDLYQHILEGALAVARGEPQPEDRQPELRLGVKLTVPAEYVPEEELRIGLYRRVAELRRPEEVDELAAEIEDRFGTPPDAVRRVLAAARLRLACHAFGIFRLEAGPQAIALTFQGDSGKRQGVAKAVEASGGTLRWRGERLIAAVPTAEPEERLKAVERLLASLDGNFASMPSPLVGEGGTRAAGG